MIPILPIIAALMLAIILTIIGIKIFKGIYRKFFGYRPGGYPRRVYRDSAFIVYHAEPDELVVQSKDTGEVIHLNFQFADQEFAGEEDDDVLDLMVYVEDKLITSYNGRYL